MKLMGWAIALAAAGLTPAAAGAQAPSAAQPQVTSAAPAAAPAPAAAAPAPAPSIDYAAPTPGIGVPDGRKGVQDQVTELGRDLAAFHDNWLLLMCALISIFVLALLVWTIVRYRRGANPTPSRTTHNTAIEVVWTLVPVLILVAIAVPSIRLLAHQYNPPKADLTVKAIGNQWYWSYEYPDHGISFDSYMLKETGETTGKEVP